MSWNKIGNIKGPKGTDGKDGISIQGPMGLTGRDGKNGERGEPGIQGPPPKHELDVQENRIRFENQDGSWGEWIDLKRIIVNKMMGGGGGSGGISDLSAFTTADLAEGVTNLYFTAERAQDAVFGAMAGSSTIDFTYNDVANSWTGAVLPGGVDHNALLNYVANEHIDHTSVSINTAANSGLAGGGTIAAPRSLTLDINNLTTDTPATADFIPFYDSSGADSNKSTIGNMQIAFWQTAPNVAHIKTDGTGTHATIALANSDPEVSLILVYPGTHTINNSSATMVLLKNMRSVGGRAVTTLERTDGSRAAIQIQSPAREFSGFTLGPAGTSSDAHWLFYSSIVFSRTLISEINCLSSMGIAIRSANNLTLEKIYAVNVGASFPHNVIKLGDASGVPQAVLIRNCTFATVNEMAIHVYGGNADVVDCNFNGSGFGSGYGIKIDSTAAGTTQTYTCSFDGVFLPVDANMSGGATYSSNLDNFKNHYGPAVNCYGGAGRFVTAGSAVLYDPGFSSFGFVIGAGTLNEGYYFDAYLKTFVTNSKQQLKSTGGAPLVGNATLVAGTKAVACTDITANSIVMLTRKTIGGTVGNLSYTLTASTGFTINSSSATDTSVISWTIIEPG